MARSGTFTLRFKCALRRTSADILVRNAGVVSTKADKNVRAPEKPKVRTDPFTTGK